MLSSSRTKIKTQLRSFFESVRPAIDATLNKLLPTDSEAPAELHRAMRYSVFAGGGKELGLWHETLRELSAPAIPSTHGFYDECIRGEASFSLGFMKPNSGFPFGSPSAFGFPGAGGSLGFADPEKQIGYGYVPSRKGVTIDGDPRDVALRRALFSATPAADFLPVRTARPANVPVVRATFTAVDSFFLPNRMIGPPSRLSHTFCAAR